MPRGPTRRGVLGALALGPFAGCLESDPSAPREGSAGPDEDGSDGDRDTPAPESETPEPTGGPPTADEAYHLPADPATLRERAFETDVPMDGIPPIDDPVFTDREGLADATLDLDGEDVVFGVEREGVAKAYPQRVLVYHEIVNDTLAGDPVAITYCPLTGTAQGFERGETTFGVSGWLLESNLVMYDRETESWWPQIYATGLDDPFAGTSLEEFRVVWTTWGRWHEAYPETRVMTAETGYERRYHDDPYGGYNPPVGYYDYGGPMYEVTAEPDESLPLEAKTVVLGCRTGDGAVAFEKERLLEGEVLTAAIRGTEHVAVAEPDLETGYVYANPEGRSVEPEGEGQYLIDGEAYAATALPLDRRLAFDAMWFAWYACYPDTEVRY